MRWSHANCVTALFLFVFIHQFRGLLFKSFRASGDVVWLTGSMGFWSSFGGFHGVQFGVRLHVFWGVVVITSLFLAIPFVGEPAIIAVWGSSAVIDRCLRVILRFTSFWLIVLRNCAHARLDDSSCDVVLRIYVGYPIISCAFVAWFLGASFYLGLLRRSVVHLLKNICLPTIEWIETPKQRP